MLMVPGRAQHLQISASDSIARRLAATSRQVILAICELLRGITLELHSAGTAGQPAQGEWAEQSLLALRSQRLSAM